MEDFKKIVLKNDIFVLFCEMEWPFRTVLDIYCSLKVAKKRILRIYGYLLAIFAKFMGERTFIKPQIKKILKDSKESLTGPVD